MSNQANSFITQPNVNSNIRDILDYIVSNRGCYHENVSAACKVLGINQDNILPKQFSDFQGLTVNKDSALINYKHYEARRYANLYVISEYLWENNIFLEDSNSLQNVNRSHSSVSPYKERKYINCSSPLTTIQISEKKLNNLIRKIKVMVVKFWNSSDSKK